VFKKATKAQSKLRAAIYGPAGSGKTFTSLSVATGLGKRIAFIDTERGSASKYSDRFDFDVCELEENTLGNYITAIGQAVEGKYDVLIIDSLTHAWKDLLEEVDLLAKTKFRGNSWSAWSEGTPRQRSFIDAIIGAPLHVIGTMRTKTDWLVGESARGKTTISRVGLAPEQGKGIEYEFDLLMEISTEHVGHVVKDRTGKFQDALIDKPDAEFGKQLHAWLTDGEIAENTIDYAKKIFDAEQVVSAETTPITKF